MELKLGHRILQAPGRPQLRQKQPPTPFHTLGGLQPCLPRCNSRCACAAPRPGSPGGPPTCGGLGRSRPLTTSPQPNFSWRGDTQGAQKISGVVRVLEFGVMERCLEYEGTRIRVLPSHIMKSCQHTGCWGNHLLSVNW